MENQTKSFLGPFDHITVAVDYRETPCANPKASSALFQRHVA